jgi:hypothetical protein
MKISKPVQRQPRKVAPSASVKSAFTGRLPSTINWRETGPIPIWLSQIQNRPDRPVCTTPLTHVSRDERGLEEKQYSFAGAYLRIRQSAMATISKVIHIEPAFDDPGFVQEMFERHAPCRTLAGDLPIKAQETFLPLVQKLVGGEW